MTALDEQVGGSHYKNMKRQPVEFIHENNLGFIEGCIIKYICRYKEKNPIEDLQKIIQYAQILIGFYNEKMCAACNPSIEYCQQYCNCQCHEEAKDAG